MPSKIVKVATWVYRDEAGVRRRAYFGDTVELTAAEVKRGEKQGVFTPAPIPAVVASQFERKLGGIEPRVNEPYSAGGDELPDPPHDVQPPVSDPDSDAGDAGDANTGDAPPATGDAAAAPALEQPRKAAAIALWREYIVAATDITEEQANGMTKDQLRAAAPES